MIGLFDSGSGGLTVLQAIREVLPSCNVTYFGDIAHAPYGSRSREELSGLTIEAIKLLKDRGCERIVSACNSVSASLAISLFDAFSIAPSDLIEMVGPTVAYFRDSPARLLLCATPATVHSGIYQDAFRMVGKEASLVAIPELAGAIEFGESPETIRALIASALHEVKLDEFDLLILACTHYPLAIQLFQQVVPQSLVVFDPAIVVAERVEKQFWPREVGSGATKFLISKNSDHFRTLVAKLFPGTAYSVEVIE